MFLHTNTKRMAFAFAMILMLAGCGGSGSGTSDAPAKVPSSNVSHACTAELMGMTATIHMTAASEAANVSSITMEIDMPASYFGLENFSSLDDQDADVKDMIVNELSTQLKLPKSDLSATTTDDNLNVTILLHEDNMRDILGLQSDASIAMQDMVKALQENDDARCS